MLTYKKRKHPDAVEFIDKERGDFLSPVLFFSFLPLLVDKTRKQKRHRVIKRKRLETCCCFYFAVGRQRDERERELFFVSFTQFIFLSWMEPAVEAQPDWD